MKARAVAVLVWLLMLVGATTASAQSRKPRLPPGIDPGGTAIAILGTGIDYTRAEMAPHLARDGEGDLIGWDFVTGDNRPFAVTPNDTPADWGGDGTSFAGRVAKTGRLRIIPIRIDPTRPETIAQALAFVARSPARIVLLPISNDTPDHWNAFRQAADRFPQIIILAAGGPSSRFPAMLARSNVLVVGDRARPIPDAAMTVEVALEKPAADNTFQPAELLVATTRLLGLCAHDPSLRPARRNTRLAAVIDAFADRAPLSTSTTAASEPKCGSIVLRP